MTKAHPSIEDTQEFEAIREFAIEDFRTRNIQWAEATHYGEFTFSNRAQTAMYLVEEASAALDRVSESRSPGLIKKLGAFLLRK